MSDQRKVLVTGVSRGLGRAMAEQFAERGHIVIGCARSREAIDSLSSQLGPPHHFHCVDVTRAGDVQQWAHRVLDQLGAPDLLLNNAAMINHLAPIWDVPTQEFSDVIDANIKGVFHVIQSFVPAMIAQGSGIIINFSSGWGRSTSPEVAPYCATKWAIEGLTRAMAEELPPDMAAVPLNPGIINTDMLRICFGAEARSYPDAQHWARRAVPFLLQITAQDNGRTLTVPD
jgi:NAD(P)-dependent dehydrogenase (short-subunit alcohol dehydrogenase family)